MASIHEIPQPPSPPEAALEAIEEEVGIPPRRVKDDSEMDITPMIDMTFLLLIFFIVASRMEESAALTLPPAKHGNAVSTKDAVVFTVTGEGESQIYKGEGVNPANALTAGDPEGKETEIAAYVEEQVASDPSIQNVVILAESGVKHRDVALVMKAVGLAQTEGGQLHVAVLEMR